MPSSSGISMSSTATSGLMRSSWFTASSPVRSDAATIMSGSDPTQREISPLITTESSTTITRNGSCRVELRVEALASAAVIVHQTGSNGTIETETPKAVSRRIETDGSDQANFLELGRDDIFVERFHDVFVGAGVERTRDMSDIVFGGAEHHLGRIATGHAAQIAEELIAVHHWHVPIEQNRLGQGALANLERLLAVLGLDDLEIQAFQNAPC